MHRCTHKYTVHVVCLSLLVDCEEKIELDNKTDVSQIIMFTDYHVHIIWMLDII